MSEPTPGAARGDVAAGGDSAAPPTTTNTAGAELRQASLWSDAWRQLRRNPVFLVAVALLAVLVLVAAFPQLFTDVDPRSCNLRNSRGGPGTNGAWFGYDIQGCDYYANVVYGARVSVVVGVLVVLGALLIGALLGALAGYYGGWFDSLTSRLTDIVFGLPLVLGAILILNAFPAGQRGIPEVSLALIALGWPAVLRLLRSSVIAIKDSDYVEAARALGSSDRRIITRHILPNSLAPVLVYSTIAIGTAIAAEATLSFLGVGLQAPSISWGLQISNARGFVRTSPHLLLFPSAFLSVTVLCFIMLGDALRDALDPKLR